VEWLLLSERDKEVSYTIAEEMIASDFVLSFA
jgi:hypothetical protein